MNDVMSAEDFQVFWTDHYHVRVDRFGKHWLKDVPYDSGVLRVYLGHIPISNERPKFTWWSLARKLLIT